jgi:outer membrane protein OmpA-like peptidoglycan-associated protein
VRRAIPGLLLATALLGLAACAEPWLSEDLFIVLPEEDGTVGEVTVTKGESTTVLNSPLAAAQVDRDGALKPAEVTEQDVQTLFQGALAAQPILPRRFVLYFEPGTDVLTPDSQAAFENVFADVERRPAPSVEVIGHTDTVGTREFNADLSLERATAIKNFLTERGIAAEAIVVAGRGELDTLVDTADEADEPRNRRVEITVR